MKTNKKNRWATWARSTMYLFALMPFAANGCDLESLRSAVSAFGLGDGIPAVASFANAREQLPFRQIVKPKKNHPDGDFSAEAKH